MTRAEFFAEVLIALVAIRASEEQCQKVAEILEEWE